MSRPHKNESLGLLPRMRLKHGAFYYVHADKRWERLGTDFAAAKSIAQRYNAGAEKFGTMAYYFAEFIRWCQGRVAAKKMAARTAKDYAVNIAPLAAYLGHMAPTDITPPHVQSYLDLGIELGRAVRVNREKSCLSACLTWIRTRRPEAELLINPCFGVRRNTETARARYVDDAEYAAVLKRCTPMARAYAEIVTSTLQRPSDVLSWTRANIRTITLADGRKARILDFIQSKTGKNMHIEIDGHLAAVISRLNIDAIGVPLIHGRGRKAYTEGGLASMWRRWCNKALAANEITSTYGVMDLRAKGATDMHLRGESTERIQALMGHKSVQTTERYIKQRLQIIVVANEGKRA
jgi:integrase